MRPKPTVYLKNESAKGQVTEVTSCAGVYYVTYKGRQVNLRKSSSYNIEPPRYHQTTFVNTAHAHNLAEKMNQLFETKLFEVHESLASHVIVEGGYD